MSKAPSMDLQQALFLLILAGALYLFISERLRVDVTAMVVLLALVLSGTSVQLSTVSSSRGPKTEC